MDHAILEQSGLPVSPDLETLRSVLDEVILELNHSDRELVLLRFFEASRLAPIGEKLGISENAVQKALDRALERMRKLLAHRGITATSAALSVAFCSQNVLAAPAGLLEAISERALTAAGWSLEAYRLSDALGHWTPSLALKNQA